MRAFIIAALLVASACGTAPEEPDEPTESNTSPLGDDHQLATEILQDEVSPAPLRKTGPIIMLASISQGSDHLYLVTADIRADVIATTWWLSDGTKLAEGPVAEIALSVGRHKLIVGGQTDGGEFSRDSVELNVQ